MAYFLALDIGGTKTDYLLADETRELARVRTPTIKRMRTDASTAANTVRKSFTSSGSTRTTRQPTCGMISRKPSAASRLKASITG